MKIKQMMGFRSKKKKKVEKMKRLQKFSNWMTHYLYITMIFRA